MIGDIKWFAVFIQGIAAGDDVGKEFRMEAHSQIIHNGW
jgi:hypothetical protein